MAFCVIDSPVGRLHITEEQNAIIGIAFVSEDVCPPGTPLLRHCAAQLREYFNHERTVFDVPLHFASGTAFQRSVWEAMQHIPYGEVRTYGQLSKIIGRPNAVRAVGGACHVNPIAIIVPCHRVVGANGLTGYAGGLDKKEILLSLEHALQEK